MLKMKILTYILKWPIDNIQVLHCHDLCLTTVMAMAEALGHKFRANRSSLAKWVQNQNQNYLLVICPKTIFHQV